MKVLLFLPKAFEHMESSVFIDVLGWARHKFSHDIQLVTAGSTQTVVSTFGVPVVVDALIGDVTAKCRELLPALEIINEWGRDLLQSHHGAKTLNEIENTR